MANKSSSVHIVALNTVADHNKHSLELLFRLPYQELPVCLECLVQILEDDKYTIVKKKPAVAELSKLLQFSGEVVEYLSKNLDVVKKCTLILVDLLNTKDSYLAQEILDVCIHLISKVNSETAEEVVLFMLKVAEIQTQTEKNQRELLPLYMYLERLLRMNPLVSVVISQEYTALLNQLCCNLLIPDEQAQTAIVAILTSILINDWWKHLSSDFLQQVSKESVCVLNSARSQSLITQCLDLVKKLVQHEDTLGTLMSKTPKGVTLMAALKKQLLTRNETLVLSTTSILALILSGDQGNGYSEVVLSSSIVEFLFECLATRNIIQANHVMSSLKTLCESDLFYSKCNSVYGIDSVIRCTERMAEMKNYDLHEKGLQILAVILTKQPERVPLFINVQTVQFCISIISKGLLHQHPKIFAASLHAFLAVIRKDHLLLPIPIDRLKIGLEVCNDRMWQVVTSKFNLPQSHPRNMKSKRKDSDVKPPLVHLYCKIHSALLRLLKEVEGIPDACTSCFIAPNDKSTMTLKTFSSVVLSSCVDKCIPLVINDIEKATNKILAAEFIGLLSLMEDVNKDCVFPVIAKLCSAGFIPIAVCLKINFGDDPEFNTHMNSFFVKMFHALCGSLDMLPMWKEPSTFNCIKYTLSSFPYVLSEELVERDTFASYLFLYYNCYKFDQMVLKGPELALVLTYACHDANDDLPPLLLKMVTFLNAISNCLTENELKDTRNLKQLNQLLDGLQKQPVSLWYTHHPALVRWALQCHPVHERLGKIILEPWLQHICSQLDDSPCSRDLMSLSDVNILMNIHRERNLLESLIDVIAIEPIPKVIWFSNELFVKVIEQLCTEDDKNHAWMFAIDKTHLVLQDMFMRNSHQNGHALAALLTLLEQAQDHLPEDLLARGDNTKIVYHVIKHISMSEDPVTRESCTKYLLRCLHSKDSTATKRIVPLLLQNDDFLMKLEDLVNAEVPSVSCYSLVYDIIEKSTQDDFPCTKQVRIDLRRLCGLLTCNDPDLLLVVLDLLLFLLKHRFISPCVIMMSPNPRSNTINSECPLTSEQMQEVYMQLQQFALQDCSQVRCKALDTMLAMINFLLQSDPKTGKLLSHSSWNQVVLEVLLLPSNQISEEEDKRITAFIQMVMCTGKVMDAYVSHGVFVRVLDYLMERCKNSPDSLAPLLLTVISKAKALYGPSSWVPYEERVKSHFSKDVKQ